MNNISQNLASRVLGSMVTPKDSVREPLMSNSHLMDTFKTVKSNVKVEELAPDVFNYLRNLDGIDEN
jgi:hypothetical protein